MTDATPTTHGQTPSHPVVRDEAKEGLAVRAETKEAAQLPAAQVVAPAVQSTQWSPGQPVPPQGIQTMGGVLMPGGRWEPDKPVHDTKRFVQAVIAYPYAEVRDGKYTVLCDLLLDQPLDFISQKWLLDVYRELNEEDAKAEQAAKDAAEAAKEAAGGQGVTQEGQAAATGGQTPAAQSQASGGQAGGEAHSRGRGGRFGSHE
jgi:hypothetical protein